MKMPSDETLAASGIDSVAPLILLVAMYLTTTRKKRDFSEFREIDPVVSEDGCLLPRLQVQPTQLQPHRLQYTRIVINVLGDPRRHLLGNA